MDVLKPKPLDTHPGDEIVPWARHQLEIARSILDNPGGGLLFATIATLFFVPVVFGIVRHRKNQNA